MRRTLLIVSLLLTLTCSVDARPPLEGPSRAELHGPLVWEPLIRGWMEGSPSAEARVALLGDADDVRRHLLVGGRPHLAGSTEQISPEALVRALTSDGTAPCHLLLVTYPRTLEPTLTLTKAFDDGGLHLDVELASPRLLEPSPDMGFAVVALGPRTREALVTLSLLTDGLLTGRLFASRRFRGGAAPLIDAATRVRSLLRSPALPAEATDRARAHLATARKELEQALRILEPFESRRDDHGHELPFLVLAQGTALAGAVPDSPTVVTDVASLRATCRLLGLSSVPDVDLELATVVIAGGASPLIPRQLRSGAPGEPLELLLATARPTRVLSAGHSAWILIRVPRSSGPMRVTVAD